MKPVVVIEPDKKNHRKPSRPGSVGVSELSATEHTSIDYVMLLYYPDLLKYNHHN